MAIFSKPDRSFAETVAELSFANPFLEKRVLLEKKALGKHFDSGTRPFWSWSLQDDADRPNVVKLTQKVVEVAGRARENLMKKEAFSDEEMELYDDLAHYVVYYKVFAYRDSSKPVCSDEAWKDFERELEYWMNVDGIVTPSYEKKAHVFAYLSQIQRAFFNIYRFVIGRTHLVASLRARIWQSIFTHDMRRYRHSLFDRMNEVSTLVIGPSGTGKELVARAIGLSQYRSFDVRLKTFADEGSERFFAVNLSALSPTLIESELFGHVKGAYTGAAAGRKGLLEVAGQHACVFLDEIGELDKAIQVKLLRVLQCREFQRIGENKTRLFEGKVVSATNRNLVAEIQSGNFRDDFYYRICSDVIETPSLVDQLNENPDEFEFLVWFVANRLAPADVDALKTDVMQWHKQTMKQPYHWPGNMRELEQCVRNIMIHNDYRLQRYSAQSDSATDMLAKKIQEVQMTADELIGRYCEIAYNKTQSYEKAAELLKLDRRTVKAKIVALQEDK